MKTLRFSTSTFDADAKFAFEYQGRRGSQVRATGYLKDYRNSGEGVVLLQSPRFLSNSYSDADIALDRRIASEEPVRDGDIVEVEGERFRVRILGDYSDAGRLIPA